MEDGTSGGIKVLIVGAGLAGLAAALSTKLANAAHEVVVFEAARELQEIGVSRPLSSASASPHPAFPSHASVALPRFIPNSILPVEPF